MEFESHGRRLEGARSIAQVKGMRGTEARIGVLQSRLDSFKELPERFMRTRTVWVLREVERTLEQAESEGAARSQEPGAEESQERRSKRKAVIAASFVLMICSPLCLMLGGGHLATIAVFLSGLAAVHLSRLFEDPPGPARDPSSEIVASLERLREELEGILKERS